MPPKSLAFAKIRSDSLAAVCEVPAGRVTTFAEVGRVLEVMPRHVAYIIATLSDSELGTIPWHRIVGDDGVLTKKQLAARGKEHISRLRAEGVAIGADGRILNWPKVCWMWDVVGEKIGGPSRGPYADPKTPLIFPPK